MAGAVFESDLIGGEACMQRFVTAVFSHETNTFSPLPTPLSDFGRYSGRDGPVTGAAAFTLIGVPTHPWPPISISRRRPAVSSNSPSPPRRRRLVRPKIPSSNRLPRRSAQRSNAVAMRCFWICTAAWSPWVRRSGRRAAQAHPGDRTRIAHCRGVRLPHQYVRGHR